MRTAASTQINSPTTVAWILVGVLAVAVVVLVVELVRLNDRYDELRRKHTTLLVGVREHYRNVMQRVAGQAPFDVEKDGHVGECNMVGTRCVNTEHFHGKSVKK